MTTIAENMSTYALGLKYEDIPAEVTHRTKGFIVDTLGCAFGGYDSEASTIARDLAGLVKSSQPATILCSGQLSSVELAAFANDAMIRYLDYNDGYISKGGGHCSDSIAALLAAAEIANTGGRELIVATVLAYDIFCGICDVWDNKDHGFDHSTVGGTASVVGVARLLGLTPQQTEQAINLTVAMNIALNQPRVGEVSKWKACAYGNANRNALFAAQLAARGMTGGSHIYEGRDGFFRGVSRRPFELAPFGGNGRSHGIMRCHLKQFPLGNFSQTVVTAALQARPLVSDIKDIAEIQIRTSKSALYVMADTPDKWRPRNSETADHSIPYTAGVALMYGTISRKYFAEEYLNNQQLLELVGKIKCSTSEEANQRNDGINLCDFEVVMRSGVSKSVRVEHHRGHSRNPMTDAEIETKFRSQVGDMLPAPRVDGLLEQLWKLETLKDVKTLIEMTRI